MKRNLTGALALVLWVPSFALAQVVIEDGRVRTREEGLRIDGFRVEAGAVNPLDGELGPMIGGAVGLGTRFWPWLDLTVGARYWKSDLDEPVSSSANSGTVTDLSLHTDLHAHLFTARGLRPYFVAGLAGHFVSADISGDSGLEDALSGFNVGVDTGVGVATSRSGLGYRAEVRRQWVEDVGNWSFALGVGWWPSERATRVPRVGETQTVTTLAVPTTPTWTQPATPPAPAADPGPSREELDAMISEAVKGVERQVAAMRAENDSLQRLLGQQAARPPVVESAPAPDPTEVAREELKAALERMAALSGRPEALRATDEGFTFDVDSALLFAPGSSQLQIGAREELRRLAVVLLRFADPRLVIDGHTDSMGSAGRNQELSAARAQAVRAELLALGVEGSRMEAIGHGSSRPVAGNDTPEGRARNRRVEIRILTPNR